MTILLELASFLFLAYNKTKNQKSFPGWLSHIIQTSPL